jgi:hypothetical protein
MSNEILQIERLTAGTVDTNANVLFDSTAVGSDNISYDSVTGIITLLEPGRYKFDWWVATQSVLSTNGASFALVSSQGDSFAGNSPIKTGEVVGVGIVEVLTAPVTVELKNNSGGAIFYSSAVSVKAVLAVIGGEGTGPTGPTGPQGETGPTGSPGPTGPGITVFGYMFTPLGENSETATLLPGNIPFSDNGLLMGVLHTAGTAEITVPESGPYTINYSISITNEIDTVVSIAVNGVVVNSTSVPTQLSFGTFGNSIILSLLTGDIVTLVVE